MRSGIGGLDLGIAGAPPAPEMGARLPVPDGQWHPGQDILPVPNRVRRMWQRAETKARVLWAVLLGRPVIYRVMFTAEAKVAFPRPGVVADCVFPLFGLAERRVRRADGGTTLVLGPPTQEEVRAAARVEREQWEREHAPKPIIGLSEALKREGF